jgi:hypothetical protein
VRPARESAHDRIRPATAAAILALNLDLAAPAAKPIVDGAGTARRIRALCCIGWSLTAQAAQAAQAALTAQVGWTVQNYSPLKDGGPDTANTARLIADLHSQLCYGSGSAQLPVCSWIRSLWCRSWRFSLGGLSQIVWIVMRSSRPARSSALRV